MRPIYAYIPPNLGKISFLDGRIKLRNLAEAIIVILLAFLVNAGLGLFLPKLISFTVCLVIIIILGIPALFGLGGEPLSVFILNIINYANTRTYVTLRPPQREVEGINIQKPKKETGLEKWVNNLFIGGPSEKEEKAPVLTKEEKKQARLDKKADKVAAKADKDAGKESEKRRKAEEKQLAKARREQEKTDKKIAKIRAKQEKKLGKR